MVVTVAEPQKIRRSGNSYVVTIPADVIERHNLKQDDLVRIQFSVLDVVPRVAPDLQESLAYALEGSEEALRYMKEH
jgi:antitoxin component of MazEF toxin-antitoxin module